MLSQIEMLKTLGARTGKSISPDIDRGDGVTEMIEADDTVNGTTGTDGT